MERCVPKTVLIERNSPNYFALLENVAEISSQFIEELQDISGLERKTVIEYYIIPWAEEAETEYAAMLEDEKNELPYYDFIDAFVERKIKGKFGKASNPVSIVP